MMPNLKNIKTRDTERSCETVINSTSFTNSIAGRSNINSSLNSTKQQLLEENDDITLEKKT
ncbi:MAG: hypothetical protein QHH06_02305 [Clostridiales bacterium]|jgi:hypothetical protein|nr:hypothetical protein [Eubacteriales bacterium]MDH7565304.1 hypothetical protein [Clostridiales bacterium]